MRPVEAIVFLSLAAGVHVGAWSLSPRPEGASTEGGPGEARVTLAAAAPQQAALARAWRTAPVTGTAVAQPAPASAEAANLPHPVAETAGPALPPAPDLSPVLPPILPAALPRSEPAPARLAPVTPPTSPAHPAPPAPDARPVAAAPDAKPPRALPMPDAPRLSAAEAALRADTTPPPGPKSPPASRGTVRKSRPARAAAPALAASGGGRSNKAQAGRGGRDQTQSANAAARNRLQAQWGARIQQRVHRRLIYPTGATGSGAARVALTISRSGQLAALRLVRSSGVAVFDKAALSAVRRVRRFPPAPKALTRDSYTFTLSLAFRR